MEEIAAVYARSLFEVAKERDKIDDVRAQLGEFADAMDASRELQTFFFSPYFSTQEKEDGLDRAVSGADEVIVNFLKLLIENHRMPVIFRVRRGYDDRIAEQTGQKVDLSASVEPDILGGIVVRVGNQVLDASIRNRLEQLRKQVARA
jgi:F0F1-type ATP synthase delta subunit